MAEWAFSELYRMVAYGSGDWSNRSVDRVLALHGFNPWNPMWSRVPLGVTPKHRARSKALAPLGIVPKPKNKPTKKPWKCATVLLK